MKPSIARTVHYQSLGSTNHEYLPEPRAAIITAVGENGMVSLCVLNPTGFFFNLDVEYSEFPMPGHWNWPPRVES